MYCEGYVNSRADESNTEREHSFRKHARPRETQGRRQKFLVAIIGAVNILRMSQSERTFWAGTIVQQGW